MSAFGDLKYPADFPHFNYVNPNAPKGGVYSEAVSSRGYNGSFLTFNSLNAYILKGEGAYGMGLTFVTLMVRSGDEPDAMYGLAARGVQISDDGLTYRFSLRPEAKFHDGAPLTAHDVAWSLAMLKDKGHPIITQQLRDFKGAEASDDRHARLLWKFDCNPKQSDWDHGDRNSIIATPVIYDGRVCLATGRDPEEGEGQGDLWCIDPTRRGDVSAERAALGWVESGTHRDGRSISGAANAAGVLRLRERL